MANPIRIKTIFSSGLVLSTLYYHGTHKWYTLCHECEISYEAEDMFKAGQNHLTAIRKIADEDEKDDPDAGVSGF